MYSSYFDIPKRLLEYRRLSNATQEQMSKLFGVAQTHYGKLEQGSKIISFRSLKCFEEHGGDVYYLITGSRRKFGEMNRYMDKCKTEQGKLQIFKFMLCVFDLGVNLLSRTDSILFPTTYKCLQLAEGEKKTVSIWENIRKTEGLTQIKMAEKLDISVKRYRRIEKGVVDPDAEILNTLYCEFEYSPMVIMDRQMFYLDEMNHIWEIFPEEIRIKIKQMLENALILINEYEDRITNEEHSDS